MSETITYSVPDISSGHCRTAIAARAIHDAGYAAAHSFSAGEGVTR